MDSKTGVLEWPTMKAEINADLEAILKKYQIGTVGGANDGGQPKPVEMKQQVPWLTAIQKDLGAKWDTGPAKGDVLAQDAKGTWGFTPVMTLAQQTVTMGRGALLGPIEGPLNGFYRGAPLGSILMGGGLSVALATAVDELYPHTTNADGSLKLNTTNLAIKGGIAFAIMTFGHRVFSSTGALIAVAVLGLNIAADLLHKPLQSLVNWIVTTWRKVTGRTTAAQNNFYTASSRQYDAPFHQDAGSIERSSGAGLGFQ